MTSWSEQPLCVYIQYTTTRADEVEVLRRIKQDTATQHRNVQKAGIFGALIGNAERYDLLQQILQRKINRNRTWETKNVMTNQP